MSSPYKLDADYERSDNLLKVSVKKRKSGKVHRLNLVATPLSKLDESKKSSNDLSHRTI